LSALILTLLPALPAAAAVSCDKGSALLGGCPNVNGQIGNGGVELDGNLTGGGSPGSGGSSGSSGSGGSGTPGSGASWGSGGASGGGSNGAIEPPRPCDERFARYCYGEGQPKPGDPAPADSGAVDTVPGTPSVTLRDIALFRPQAATQYMQPDGWMVVGLPTNFYAAIDRHIVSATLLGAPADVRFTPVGYRWRYGDGNSVRLTTKGAPWLTETRQEFEATPTSHVYRASGTYVIELDVEYTAEYRFAGGTWRALDGIIVLPANDLIATAGGAVTVLVERNCLQTPSGPGC